MRFALFLTILWLTTTTAAAALAQDSTEAPAGYDHVIDQAVAEFGSSHWAEARALFLQGHGMFPNARTLRGIGMTSYELRDYPEAVRALDDALASTVRPLTDEQRTQVTELRERAAAFVGRYEVPAAPQGARLYVDGEHVTIDDAWPVGPGHVLLGIGEHQVAIRLDDGRSSTARVVVRGHTEGALDIDLGPLQPHAAVDAPPSPPPVAPPPSYDVPPAPPSSGVDAAPWVVLGVGLAVAIGGVVLVAVGQEDIASIEHAAHGTPWSSLQSTYDRTPIETGVGGTLLGVGLAAAVVGLVWGVAQLSASGAHERPVALDVGLGTISVRGRF